MNKVLHLIAALCAACVSLNATESLLPLTGAEAAAARPKAASVSLKADGLALTPGGRLFLSVQDGRDEAGAAVVLYEASVAKLDSMVPCTVFAAPEGESMHHGVLWTDPEGRLWLFFARSKGYYDGVAGVWATVCAQPDEPALRWSRPVRIGDGIPSGVPVVAQDGAWLLPAALWGRERADASLREALPAAEGRRGPALFRSADSGASWQAEYALVPVPGKVEGAPCDPQLTVSADGKRQLYLRSCGTAWMYRSESAASGSAWTAPLPSVLQPDQPFCIRRLADGRILLVKNALLDEQWYIETKGLYAYLSDTEGRTWYGGFALDMRDDVYGPVAAQGADGTLYVAWTYRLRGVNAVHIARTTSDRIEEAVETGGNTSAVPGVTLAAGASQDFWKQELDRLNAPKTDWASEPLRVGTYNIQYPVKSPSWKQRIPALTALVRQYRFDVFGAQEPWGNQMDDLDREWGAEYAWVGSSITLDPKNRTSHYNPIFYRRDRVECLDHGTVWFSETPGTPGYGAHSARLMNWGKFRDKRTGKVFFCFNSHYDHIGIEARDYSSDILVQAVRDIAQGMPSFLTGDFNSDENTSAYKKILASGFLADSMLALPEAERKNWEYFSMSHYKPISTVKKSYRHIDHVFYTPANSRVGSWQLILDSYDGVFGSDHLPILIEWTIAN